MISKEKKDAIAKAFTVRFDASYAIANTKVPANSEDVPQIIGWSAPARSGTTAFLYLLASQPGVDRAYFQPQKTLMRIGGPAFEIRAEDRMICMKEVFGGDITVETIRAQDPIDILLKAGVPASKITWVTMLREPTQTYGSLLRLHHELKPEVVFEAQNWALELFHKHRAAGIKMIPFAYELVKDNEERAVKAIFEKLGVPFEKNSLIFNSEEIGRKLVPGQMADQDYFENNIKPNFDRTKYEYKDRRYDRDLPEDVILRVKALCDDGYYRFRNLAKRELGL